MFLVEQGDSPLGALLSSSLRGHLHFPLEILIDNRAQSLRFRARADPRVFAEVYARRVECDECNSYAAQLENALVHHNRIWIPLLALRVPGKGGCENDSVTAFRPPSVARSRCDCGGSGSAQLPLVGPSKHRIRRNTTIGSSSPTCWGRPLAYLNHWLLGRFSPASQLTQN